ncbi:TonB-dependent receptor [Chitinophaga dinghuensis]|uniref:TonB-dependent receptor n=1 Tax=Chitinophaga dinghuensis TaxID=1539050 RepID=A0A327W518_9BACT|nr:TonB-dependent receptor [Chitinophaga dinghuensis]RAJ83114.1 TonB-dependent receptor [Chitinophaga dinghuensis]
MDKVRQTFAFLLPIKWRQLGWFLLLLISSQIMAQSPALNKPITIHATNTNLAAVIAELDKQSECSFSYDRASLAAVPLKNIQWNAVPLKTILEELNTSYGIKYQVTGQTIAVKLANPAKSITYGGIRGRIVDFETSTPLPGATIRLEGTTFGAVTDNKGFYQLNNIPTGNYSLVVTFIGYQQAVIANVQVSNGQNSARDVKMQTGSNLKEVQIASGPRKVRAVTHSTEQQLLEEIKNATGVVSGISNELISKTADRNAAEVVKRISGITVVDDRFIVVRGMNERYNLTYLNSNVAPSTELYSKAFAYDLLPSSVIDKILVYKSPVADLVGDYAGAAIKVSTKNAMPVRHFDAGIQFAARDGAAFSNIESYNGGKTDFLGFDDGTRKLPAFSPGIFESNRRNNNMAPHDWVNNMSPVLSTGKRYALPDMQVFGNYYNSWKLGSWRLFDLTSLTYTKETVAYDVYRQTGNTYALALSDDIGQSDGYGNKIGHGPQSTETGKINLLENLTLRFNDRHQIAFMNFFVNDGKRFTSVYTSAGNAAPSEYRSQYNTYKEDMVLSFQQRMLYSGNLNGAHQLGKDKQHTINWNLGFTHDLQNVPDQRIIHFVSSLPARADSGTWMPGGSNFDFATTKQGMMARLYIRNLEQVYNGSADYSVTVNKNLSLKTGAYMLFKVRQVGRRFFRVNRAGLQPEELYVMQSTNDYLKWNSGYNYNDPNLLQYQPKDLSHVWSNKYFPDDGTGLAVYDLTSPTDAYVASEQYNAFYAMGDWKTAKEKFTVNAGLRLEYDRQKLAGARNMGYGEGAIESVDVDHKKTILLPSVNLNYRPNQQFVVRAGYGRTVNRPDFRELTPYGDFDFQRNEEIKGNPRIVTAVIDNIDLRAELYPHNKNEVLNIGVFYKHLQHPIEKMREDVTNTEYKDGWNYSSIFYDNAVSAQVMGAEAEIKKSLSFIPGNVFRQLSVVLNGTYIHSTTERRKVHNDYSSDTAHTDGGPLQGQAPYIVNAGLFYENVATGTKASFVYNFNGPSIYAKSVRTINDSTLTDRHTRPDLLQLGTHLLDFSLTQRIIKSLQVKFSIQNLLDQSYRLVEDQNFDHRYNKEEPVTRADNKVFYKGDNIYTKYKPGRYFLLQFTYSF